MGRLAGRAVIAVLAAAIADLRAQDAPDLIEAFGWCSTIRDLREDIEKGLVNIPATVIETARAEGLDGMEYDALVRATAVKQWMWNEYQRATRHLNRFENELLSLRGRNGVAILRLFHRSIRRFAETAAKTYGWSRTPMLALRLHPEVFAAVSAQRRIDR